MCVCVCVASVLCDPSPLPFPQRQRQFKVQEHLLMKNRNELLLGIARCNSLSMQYFNMDVMDIIEVCVRLM